MPRDVAGGVRGPLTGRQTLTSLCPQGVPGASGLKGDKVEGAGLPAPSCTLHPVVPSASPPRPPATLRRPPIPLAYRRCPVALQGEPGAGLPGARGERGEPGVRVRCPALQPQPTSGHHIRAPFITDVASKSSFSVN